MKKFPFSVSLIHLLFFFAFTTTVPAGDRFTDNGDGTVTDHALGLMWAKTDNQGDINWHQADKWVHYTFPYSLKASYDNWRLPTLNELKSLYVEDAAYKGYETDCGQRVKISKIFELSCGWLWSSEKRSISARLYNFNRGVFYTDRLVHKRGYRAIAVRDLK